MDKFVYKRNINYYETDKMGVVHHSNYARFLEECRIEMMDYYDMSFTSIEDMGYMIPVLELNCSFKESVKFGEKIVIVPTIYKVTPARFYVSYVIYDETMTHVKHEATTSHCFVDSEFNIVSIKKSSPEIYEKLRMIQGGQDA